MIYFLNNDLQLQKIVTSENINRAQHENEMNNLKMMTLEMDLAYAKSFLNDDVDHFGYYVKDAFHVAKIRRMEESHDGETLTVIGHHIFFSDMIYGRLVEDVRPENRDAAYILSNTIGANTRWHPVITDTTGVLSTNFYWTTPMEVVEFVVENFRLEFEPEILFDGQKVNGLNVHFKKRLGEDKPKRVVYGPSTPTLEYDIDYSEVVTKLAVHGKGEEVGDGYGRRINFSDRNINRDGIVSPLGSRYLEDPDITANYGNFDNEPKHTNVIFEDIENVNELIEAGIEEYERLSRPQYIFTAEVSDIGDVNMGDSVLIVRREYGIYFRARVHKISVDLLNPEGAEVVLGDYEHFKETKAERSARRQRESNERAVNSRITQLKNAFDARFDGEVAQMWEDYEQALIDAHAEIDAAEQRMQDLLDTERAEFNERFETEMQEAYDEAERNYGLIRDDITDTVDSTRDELMENFENQVSDTRQYAEQQAQERADGVRDDLTDVTSSHQGLLDDLKADVLSIDNWRGDVDDFLGDVSDITLDERLQAINLHFEERIRNIDSTHYNMLRGTSFDNPDLIDLQSTVEIITNETDNFARLGLGASNIPFVGLTERFQMEEGQTYHLIVNYRTEDVPEMDYIEFRGSDLSERFYLHEILPIEDLQLVTDGLWNKHAITFVAPYSQSVQVFIGTNFSLNNTQRGILDIKKPYLTTTNNREWLPHPDDDTQNVSEIVSRVTQLEDGRRELITRTEYDFDTEQIDQTVKEIEDTVDVSRQMIVDIENMDVIKNGSEVMQTVDGFEQKVWMNDVADIGANLIPQSSNAWEDGGLWIEGGGESGNTANIRLKENIIVQSSTDYTLQDDSTYVSAINTIYVHEYTVNGTWLRSHNISRGGELTFRTHWNTTNIRITYLAMSDFTIHTRYVEHIDGRIKVKLEKGNSATPFMNALSRVEQLADKVSIAVAEIDGSYVTQSELSVVSDGIDAVSSRISDVEEDYVEQSSVIVRPEYAQIGSVRIDGDTVGSMLRVSPDGIDAVAEAMRLSGDLYVDGDVETLAISAIEGEFARLWADEFNAITIDVGDIQGITAEFERMYTLNANIERLVSQNVFADGVTALVGNFVDVNAGNIVTSGLSANIIESEHIAVGTALIDKLFATSARIDRLITKTHFVNEIKATSIDAVYADLRSVNSEIMTSNIIKSNWLNVDTALFNRFTSSEAFIDRLEVKAANIRDLTGIHIQGGLLESLNGNTRFNLNTGFLDMANTRFRLGGGADIEFASAGNRLYYERVDGSTTRTSGLGVGNAINNRFPIVWMGTTGTTRANFDPSDGNYFTGFIANTSGRHSSDGIQNSVVGNLFQIRDEVIGFNRGFEFSISGSIHTFRGMSTNSNDYNLGQSSAPFTSLFMKGNIHAESDFAINNRTAGGSIRGWRVETNYSGNGDAISLHGLNGGSYNYQLGSSRRSSRLLNIYLTYEPNVSSDARLKENIEQSKLGLDFINDLNPKQFNLKLAQSDRNQGIKSTPLQQGLLAQDVAKTLSKYNMKANEISLLNVDDDGYLSLRYAELITPTINAVQKIDKKVESNTEKIARLEKEIEMLKGA